MSDNGAKRNVICASCVATSTFYGDFDFTISMHNPFYSGGAGSGSSGSSVPPPPSYSSRPLPTAPTAAASHEPVQFSSLSDLTKNKPVAPPRTKPAFSYTPDASRAGYTSGSNFTDHGPAGTGGGDGRRMPPPPSNYGVGIPSEPPRRNVATSPATAAPTGPNANTGPASYLPASAQGYANTASSYASAGVGKAREGIDSLMTQQRREQVTNSLGKAAAGGAKLLGQGAWKLGKFASNPTGK